MKTSFVSKVGSVLIVAALAGFAYSPNPVVSGGEIIVKRGASDLKRPASSLFAAPEKAVTGMNCAACKPEFVPVTTQDTKLKTKVLLTEKHACKSCVTTIASNGAPKATRVEVAQHSCGGRVVSSSSSCCSGMPNMN